ncbi:unnamed protein product, partial [Aphanomyces euteiches]
IQDRNPEDVFHLQAPSRSTIVEWINNAWDAVPSGTIISGFRRTKLLLNNPPLHLANEMENENEDNSLNEIAQKVGEINIASELQVDDSMTIFD